MQKNDDVNKNLCLAVKMAKELLELANRGDDQRNDVGCGVLYGTVRDCAYKIRMLAIKELKAHHAQSFPVGKTG